LHGLNARRSQACDPTDLIGGEDGVWRVPGLNLPVPGRSTFELEIPVSDFEMLRLSESLEVRP
jgi:copper transport protein